jgi:hypothetical protein
LSADNHSPETPDDLNWKLINLSRDTILLMGAWEQQHKVCPALSWHPTEIYFDPEQLILL